MPQEDTGEQETSTEGAEKQAAHFGGLGPVEAGRRGAEARRKRLALAGGAIQPDLGLANIRKIAETGKGTQAVQAQRYLDERARDEDKGRNQALLSMLTPAQRACVQAALKGGHVSQAQAIEAWCEEVPANEGIP